MNRYIPYNAALKERAREMRNNPTLSEQRFWFEVLRNENFYDYKFLRQKILLNYIVDFYCSELLLAIELDGESHLSNEEYDRLRTVELNKYGVKIIRYYNYDISGNLGGVSDALLEEIFKRKKELR
ncbi:MAG: endonuclease domain-containing protein [Patescibacteria group bacterium]